MTQGDSECKQQTDRLKHSGAYKLEGTQRSFVVFTDSRH